MIEFKIEHNNKIYEELESMSKTIYDYWFLQFEFPDEEGKPYKSSGGNMLWNKELKREIPKGWSIENLAENSISKILQPGVDEFKVKNYLATANVNNEEIRDGNWVTYENRESRANMQPIEDSVWFAKMKNSIKHITLTKSCKWFIDKYILSTGFLGIKCNSNSLPYIHCFINNFQFEFIKDRLAHGATQEAINNDDLKNMKLLIPHEAVLVKFSNIIYPILQRKIDICKENQELEDLRDFILPLLINGQVGFKDEEELILAGADV